jgi:pimeloyl-ACP methyl ester carboxylesterase
MSALALVALVGEVAFERLGAHAIIDAPNQGRAAFADEERPAGVAQALQLEVGPPRARLAVWIVDPVAEPRGTVFVLHGIRDGKSSLLGWGRMLASAGFRAVLVDLRGQGHSTGDVLSYGVIDSRDLSQVLDALAARRMIAGRVGAMGMSYGAATAIEWAGHEPRVTAVVAVAPFESLRAVVPLYASRLVPLLGRLLPDWTIRRTIDRAGRSGGYSPDDASPLAAIASTRAQVLLIHGSDDHNIPSSHSERLHERAPDHSEVIVIDGEDHDTITADRSGTIAARAPAWFARWQ